MAMGIDWTPASMAVMDRPSSDQPVVRIPISTAAANTTLVAAATSPSRKIRVLNFMMVVKTTAVDIKFQSTTSTDISGAMTPNAGIPLCPSYDPNGHFETNAGELLNLNQSGTSQISGWLTYQLVDPLD